MRNLTIVTFILTLLILHLTHVQGEVTANFGDPFRGNALQNPNWQWRNEPGHWDVGQTRTNFLHIEGEINRDLWVSDNTHLLYQETTADAFDVETHFFAKSNTSSGVTGLVVKSPADNNWVTLKFWSRGPANELLQYQTKQNGLARDVWVKPTPGDTEMFFRLRKTGDTYTGWYKIHSADPWIEIGTRHFPLTPPLQLGIYTGVATNSGTFTVDYEYFKDTLSTNPDAIGDGPGNSNVAVNIPDPNLRAAIEKALGKASGTTITRADMLTLTKLDARYRSIQDLTGLEFATNLERLYLSYNQVSDVSALASLTELGWLWLNRNQISDVSALASLTNLTRLDIERNRISDVSTLGGLTNLTVLYLSDNRISDVSALRGLTNLKRLYLSDNQISDFSPIAGLVPNLTEYSNEDQRVEGVVDLNTAVNIPDPNLRAAIENTLGKASGATITRADMLTLKRLEAKDQGIQDLTGIEFATNLTWLSLDGNDVSDVSALGGLINLELLYVHSNQVSDISLLSGLTNLRWLSLGDNDVSDVSGLASLINLEWLFLSGNDVSDVSVLGGLTNLERLHFSNNQVSDVSALASLINLTELWLHSNQVSDVSVLGGLTNLERLHFSNNQVSDVSALASLINLTELALSDNRISDFSALAGLIPNLTEYRTKNQRVGSVVDLNTAVTIPDPNLRAALEEALGKASGATITRADMLTLTRLDAIDRGIQDLTGIEFATNLEGLVLRENQVSDISVLGGLINLSWLDLSGNDVSDISVLGGLINLKWLDLSGNDVSDISVLGGLTNLGSLYLSDNDVSDISVLGGLTNLGSLSLRENQVSDISPLASLINLKWLELSYNRISDVSPLASLINLTVLSLGDNDVSDISVLGGLTNLKRLHLYVNQVSDISPLASLINLTMLFLSYNQVSDISPLSGLTNLTELNLSYNQVSDVSLLVGLTDLEKLFLSGNQVSDFSPIAGLIPNLMAYRNEYQRVEGVVDPNTAVNIPDPNLRAVIEEVLGKASGATITRADMLTLTELDAIDRGIEDLTGIEFATNLTRLGLGFNQVSDVSGLVSLKNLTGLSLFGNDVSDVSGLASLKNLTGLSLSGNDVSDVSALASLINLTELYFYSNDVSDVSALVSLKNLTELDFSNNQVSDVSALVSLKNLEVLHFSNNQVSDISALVSLKNLRLLYLGENEVSDISVLGGLTDLRFLSLFGNAISDISALRGLTNLEKLYLRDNDISDVSPLASLRNLTELHLSDNEISDFSPIAGLVPNLTEYSNEDQRVEGVVDLNTAVNIPDPNLRAAIENTLGKASGATITRADMLTLTVFDARRRSIHDLTGIEFATNLTELHLPANPISDVSALAGLANLKELYFLDNEVSDISPLAGLTNLEVLSLSVNQVSDISALGVLTNLTRLYLYDNEISDVSALRVLTNLTRLSLSGNEISDVSPLSGLTNLERLFLHDNRISDFSPIAGLIPNLTEYRNENQRVVDLNTPVNIPDLNLRAAIEEALGKAQGATITKADMLELIEFNYSVLMADMYENENVHGIGRIQDLTGLEFAQNLKTFVLFRLGNLFPVFYDDGRQLLPLPDLDLSPLANLKNLRGLFLPQNKVSDISPLAGLTNLKYLNLENNEVSDVSALGGLTNLEALSLSNNQISDFSPIAGLIPNLTDYRNEDQRVNIPDPVLRRAIEDKLNKTRNAKITRSDMLKLTTLSALGRGIKNIVGLESAINLRELFLKGNDISDVSSLAGLRKLTKLWLNSNEISDVSALGGLTNLTELYLPFNKISDVSALASLTNLTELDLSYNRISDFSPIAGLPVYKDSYKGKQAINVPTYPDTLVNIPDSVLRTSLEEILGKTQNAPITRGDMAILRWLTIDGSKVQDLTGLEFAINLDQLTIHSLVDLPSLAPFIKNLKSLTRLNLMSVQLSDISPLVSLTNLEILYLNRNQISDISPLAQLKDLAVLGLNGNKISDISALAGLVNLVNLDLSNNQVSDIFPLSGLKNLTSLDIGNNRIWDISALAGLKNLENLDLHGNQVSNVWPLLTLPNLPDSIKRRLRGMMTETHRCDFNMPHIHGQRLQPSTHAYTITTKSTSPKVSSHDGQVKFAPHTRRSATLNWTYETTVASESERDPTTITVRFLNGKRGVNGVMREIDIVEEAARTWAEHGYLRFKFLYPGQAGASDIRVEFKYDYLHEVKIERKTVNGVEEKKYTPTGKVVEDYKIYYKDSADRWESNSPDDAEWRSYKPPSNDHYLDAYSHFSSHYGTVANNFKNKATMKFTSDFSFGTALHEFGHALGLAHEHLSPKFKEYFKWTDIEDVHDYFQEHTSLTRQDVAHNVLNTIAVAIDLEGVDFDPDSIMTYDIPANLIEALPNAPQWAKDLAANGISRGNQLSFGDKKGVSVLYPEPEPIFVDCEISVRAKDDDFGKHDWFDNRNNPTEFTFWHTHHSPTVKYLHKQKRTYITGGDREVRVEVHVAVRNFRYSDETLELGVYALLYEENAYNASSTTDLEDIACKTVRIPLGGSRTVKLDRLKNRCGVWNLKWKDTRCANLYKHGELYLGDASDIFCKDYSDWADVTVKLSVRSARVIATSLAPSRVSVQDASSVDVNGDGQVDAADLLLVSNYIGQTGSIDPRIDVNGDGIVTIADLVLVAQYLGQSTYASLGDSLYPSAPVSVVVPVGLRYNTVAGWIDHARVEDDGSLAFRQGIAKLEYLLTLIIPEETALLHNYPNPFNPETWIPYHLSEPAEVVLTIYSVDGKVVRRLDLGHQGAGYYQSKSRAGYWDGRNAVGERVASGLYFYTLTAGDFAATQKMLILK